ncbi:SigE family RNA polymerase sigma factor [Actinophytocola oryzae]|uniref:RNA polymerase sigma-70 factor (Sigma-E family) n=1 Tax=Actinophytocola oryzae TaxID=502181 RepID=A0A4R7W0G5_9PSEU|nr:SigE family RNA polymerase sigma factor [Actinophytocola oryzae]TDV55319.1 RNA polymerase sigma-70 factor (sigma-E family) [Actinophytocola oryzae]
MAGSDDDFADFYSARFVGALRTAYALCGDWVEAEELAQGSFVRLYPKWARVADGNADGYLRTTLVRLFLDARRRGRAKERLVAETPERPDQTRDDVGRVDDQQSLLAALQNVPPRQRATLVLRIVHDLPVEQVAQELRCSTGTVKSQLSRGIQALRAAYRDVETPERSVRDVG